MSSRGVPGVVHWGTSSWSEKSWVGPFYPPGTKPGDFLAHYATRFSTVEADNTYYAVPRRQLVDRWARILPDGFRLAAKFPRSIVHAGNGPRPDSTKVLLLDEVGDDAERFLEVMGHMGAKCGPLVLQFPYFNRQVFADRAEFLERLDRFLAWLPADFRYGVELRNRNWVDEDVTELLRTHRVALVLVDIVSMPHPAHLARSLDLFTTDFTYARLIGNRKQIDALTETFDRIVLDQAERLAPWAELLREAREKVPDTYVYANNHYAGHGPATIRELQALTEG